MSRIQRFFRAIFPASWWASMEADSRRWVMRCPCGYHTSIWEMGGIRSKASGKSWTRGKCGQCGQKFWGALFKLPDVPPAADQATESINT